MSILDLLSLVDKNFSTYFDIISTSILTKSPLLSCLRHVF